MKLLKRLWYLFFPRYLFSKKEVITPNIKLDGYLEVKSITSPPTPHNISIYHPRPLGQTYISKFKTDGVHPNLEASDKVVDYMSGNYPFHDRDGASLERFDVIKKRINNKRVKALIMHLTPFTILMPTKASTDIGAGAGCQIRVKVSDLKRWRFHSKTDRLTKLK